MSGRWRIVDLTEFDGEVTSKSGRLTIDGQNVPLADVATVLAGMATHWSGAVVSALAHYDVPLIVLDWRGLPVAATTGYSGNSRVAARQLAQAALSKPRRKNGWMRIVKAKIVGQAHNLEPISSESAARLHRLAARVRSGDPMNIEARAARTYWSTLFGGSGFTRAPGAGAGTNALLDYGYAVLRGLTVRAICVAGLNPTLGCHHRNRGNAFALADDLVEPLRPCVDHSVIMLGEFATLSDRDVKRTLVEATHMPIAPGAGSVLGAINQLAIDYARYVEGLEPVLKVPVWQGGSG